MRAPIIRFHENLSSQSHDITCRRTDRQTDMAKLIGTFHDYTNVPEIQYNTIHLNENIVTKLYCTEDLLMREIRMFIIYKAGVTDLHI